MKNYLSNYYTNQNKKITYHEEKIIFQQIENAVKRSLSSIVNEKQEDCLSLQSIIYTAIEQSEIQDIVFIKKFNPYNDLDIFPDIAIKITQQKMQVFNSNEEKIFDTSDNKTIHKNSDEWR